jgi:hypothetical protein
VAPPPALAEDLCMTALSSPADAESVVTDRRPIDVS